MNKNTVHCLIMAGGKGLRFWPKSREKKPKQLLNFFFDRSLLEQTINRVSFTDKKNITISTNSDIADDVLKYHDKLIVEPLGRNTAPCIAYACFKISQNLDDVMVVLPSDQYIKEEKKFNDTIKKAIDFASTNDYIVSLSIKPSSPHTGYGYIEAGELIKDDLYQIKTFKEKPDLNTAKAFIEAGNYFWNAGIFVFKISVMLDAVKEFMPDLYDKLSDIVKKDNPDYFKKNYPLLKSESIDYGVMEKVKNKACITANFYWDDLGSWESLEKYLNKYKFGNSNDTNVEFIDSKNLLVNQYNKNKITALIGLEDLLIVDTEDVLLISKKDKASLVKNIVNNLKDKKLDQYL